MQLRAKVYHWSKVVPAGEGLSMQPRAQVHQWSHGQKCIDGAAGVLLEPRAKVYCWSRGQRFIDAVAGKDVSMKPGAKMY